MESAGSFQVQVEYFKVFFFSKSTQYAFITSPPLFFFFFLTLSNEITWQKEAHLSLLTVYTPYIIEGG